MKDNLTLAHSMTCTTLKKAILNGGVIFRSYSDLYVALLESLVVRVLCVFFLNIYFFQHAFNLSTKRKKRQCLKIFFFWG